MRKSVGSGSAKKEMQIYSRALKIEKIIGLIVSCYLLKNTDQFGFLVEEKLYILVFFLLDISDEAKKKKQKNLYENFVRERDRGERGLVEDKNAKPRQGA